MRQKFGKFDHHERKTKRSLCDVTLHLRVSLFEFLVLHFAFSQVFQLLLQQLLSVQCGVDTAKFHQLVMCALFGNSPLM